MKKIISFGIMALLLISMAFAYGGGSSGVFYKTTYKTTTDNFLIHKQFSNQALISLNGNSANSFIQSVDVKFDSKQSGSIDIYESTKYKGNKLGNLNINRMYLIDSPKFSSATLHLVFDKEAKDVSRIMQRISTDGKSDVWIDLFPDKECTLTQTKLYCDVTVKGTGLIVVLN